MAVNLSPFGGVGVQFFDNSGNPLTGGKIFTYTAGTTTPQTTYTTSAGSTAHSNPIILDAGGRVPSGGEIWLTDGLQYKFLLKDANDVQIASYDNITGINSNFVAFTNQQEIITATAGQTVFPLTISYQPGTNSLSVFVDGVNQYGPGAQYSYVETDANTVTFNSGLHVGAEVKFTTTQQQGAGAVDASQVSYEPPFMGSVATNVEAKLAQTISILDFGADPTGTVNATSAIASAIAALPAAGGVIQFPPGEYLGHVEINRSNVRIEAFGATLISDGTNPAVLIQVPGNTVANVSVTGLGLDGDNTSTQAVRLVRSTRCLLDNLFINKFKNHGVYITGDGVGAGTQTQVQMCRIDAASSPDSGAAGISIGGGGVSTTVRLLNNYITNYEIGLYDAGVNTVGIGNTYELAVNPVITGAGGVYTGDWMESGSMLSPDFYSVTDARVTIIGPQNTAAANIVSGAPGQYPADANRIMVENLVVQGPTLLADGGLQWYSTSVGGAVQADAPKNLRGYVQISGANTSATVTFANVEPNATYYVVATPVTLANTPATGSTRITNIVKSTTGFTLHVETAPGGAGIVTFDWMLVR